MTGGTQPGGTQPGGTQHANDAWEALLTAHAVLMREFAAEDIWAEASMREYDVLYTLAKCAEPERISDLNHRVLLSQPALSRLVARLVDRGLVRREPDTADGRGIRLSLTGAGRDLQRQIGRRHARSVAHAVRARLTRPEQAELERIGRKLAGRAADSRPAAAVTTEEETEHS